MSFAKLLPLCLALVGCGGRDDIDTVDDLCTRLDDCNYLQISRDACVANRRTCVQRLTESQRDDWVDLMDSCLRRDSCELFGPCWANVPWC